MDRTNSTCTYSEASAVRPPRRQVVPLASIEAVEVRTHEWSDGAPTFSLVVKVSGGASFVTGTCFARADADRAQALVQKLLAGTPS